MIVTRKQMTSRVAIKRHIRLTASTGHVRESWCCGGSADALIETLSLMPTEDREKVEAAYPGSSVRIVMRKNSGVRAKYRVVFRQKAYQVIGEPIIQDENLIIFCSQVA